MPHDEFTRFICTYRIVFGLCFVLACFAPSAASSLDTIDADARLPPGPEPFVAEYDVQTNGLTVGTVTVSLSRDGEGTYLLRQESTSRGLGGFVASSSRTETSRWKLFEGRIRALEYDSKLDGGDDEENAHLRFDWAVGRVRSVGDGAAWEIAIAPGVVDPLLMQMAMAIDLAGGKEHLVYQVPRQGRIKTFVFNRVGEETVSLQTGSFRTMKVIREDDRRDHTVIWSAPDLGYLAVRIWKERAWNVDMNVQLRKLDRPARK